MECGLLDRPMRWSHCPAWKGTNLFWLPLSVDPLVNSFLIVFRCRPNPQNSISLGSTFGDRLFVLLLILMMDQIRWLGTFRVVTHIPSFSSPKLSFIVEFGCIVSEHSIVIVKIACDRLDCSFIAVRPVCPFQGDFVL